MAITHASVNSKPRNSTATELEIGNGLEDYEKLEHVGDALLGSVVTCLLHDLYPHIGPGIATNLKGHLVSNYTLAQLSVRYGLPDRLIADPSALWVTRTQQKTKANLFESHVAGVFYSYLQSERPRGPSTISVIIPGHLSEDGQKEDSNKKEEDDEEPFDDEDDGDGSPVSSPTDSAGGEDIKTSEEQSPEGKSQSDKILQGCLDKSLALHVQSLAVEKESKSSSNESSSSTESSEKPSSPDSGNTSSSKTLRPHLNRPTRGQAFDYLDTWLRPLYVPLAEWALEQMKKEQARLDALFPADLKKTVVDAEAHMIGARGILSQHVIDKMKGPAPFYNAEANGEGSWKVTCKVMNKIGEEWTAVAARPTKKAAASAAAYDICQQLRLEVQ